MIISNFPKNVILDNSIEDKHINGKLSANVLKINNDFNILDDGSLSLKIELVNSLPDNYEDDKIYLVSNNNVINSLSNNDKNKIDKLIINQTGNKFLSNDGTYKEIDSFIKEYYNFDEFSSTDLLDVFNQMIYPSLLYGEIIDNVDYPFSSGQLTILKISNTSANLIFFGLDQNIYTATINNGQISNWKNSSISDTAVKLATPIKINEAPFDGSQSINASEMNVAQGNNSKLEINKLSANSYIRIANCETISTGTFLLKLTSNEMNFNLNFDLSFNEEVNFYRRLFDSNENNNTIKISYKNNVAYIDLKIIKDLTNVVIEVNSFTNDWNLQQDILINNILDSSYIVLEYDLTRRIQEDLIKYNTKIQLSPEWINMGINLKEKLFTGSYIIRMNIHNNIYSGILSWYNEDTYVNQISDEILLQKSGSNNSNEFCYLRTYQDTTLTLQICCNKNIGITDCEIVFRRLT